MRQGLTSNPTPPLLGYIINFGVRSADLTLIAVAVDQFVHVWQDWVQKRSQVVQIEAGGPCCTVSC